MPQDIQQEVIETLNRLTGVDDEIKEGHLKNIQEKYGN